MSQVVSQTGSAVMTTAASSATYSVSSSSSSSYSATSSSTSSASTKVMKQSTTTVKSSSSSSSSTTSSGQSSNVNVRSSGMSYSDRIAGDLGIDVGKEMERLRLCMSSEMTNIHSDMFRLKPGSPDAPSPPALDAPGSAADGSGFVVKLDDNAVRNCIDKAHDDRMKLNFDVQEFDSETINIKTVGNKIEVHAMKKSKKGDEERSEEFSRVYELPTEKDVDPKKVTSSIYQDGVLTIELPVADALGQQPQAQ